MMTITNLRIIKGHVIIKVGGKSGIYSTFLRSSSLGNFAHRGQL